MAYKEVERLFQCDVEETYNITVGSEVITTTEEYPFWIVGKGWVKSKDLVVGEVLTTSDGKVLAIEKIEVKKEHKTVYNFKVKDFHTYFVSNLGIWTHNSCLLGPERDLRKLGKTCPPMTLLRIWKARVGRKKYSQVVRKADLRQFLLTLKQELRSGFMQLPEKEHPTIGFKTKVGAI
ncbi:hypothetical protein D3C76_719030 [compost metagenome]